MKAFLIRQRWLAIVFVVLLVWLTGFELWRRETFTAPLKEPVLLSSPGKIEQDFRIRLDAPHEMQIVFSAGTRPREAAMRLVGSHFACSEKGSETPCDVTVPLQWRITDATGQVVASGERDTRGITSWATSEFWRIVEPSIRLPVGRYHLSATVPREIPEFHGMGASLSLALLGRKISFGWQSDLLLFGGLLNFFLTPMTGSFGMILLGQAVGDWARGRRRS